MAMNGNRRDAVAAGYSVGEFSNAAEPSQRSPQSQAVRVELIGDDRASGCGLAVTTYAPFCEICRRLIAAGLCPDLPVEAYRGATLALRAAALRIPARLTVGEENGCPRFRRYPQQTAGAGPPIAQNAPALAGQPAGKNNAPTPAGPT